VQPYRVFVSEHYRAALIITLEEGIPHLDKFAVSEDAQGEGLGRAAWQVMRAAVPRPVLARALGQPGQRLLLRRVRRLREGGEVERVLVRSGELSMRSASRWTTAGRARPR
jgi:hypothetical protein